MAYRGRFGGVQNPFDICQEWYRTAVAYRGHGGLGGSKPLRYLSRMIQNSSGVPRGVWGGSKPRTRNYEGPPKSCQTLKPIVKKTVKNCWIREKKCSKILKLPPVRNCFTLAMTNKLVVIINSLKVPKIKKNLLYEIKFLVPNYSCLQNPWLGG